MSRAFLIAAALLLLATSAFHLTGLEQAAGWAEGDAGRIVAVLWVMAAVGWFVLVLMWLVAAFRPGSMTKTAVVLSAAIPAAYGIAILLRVDPMFPGGYMLVGAAILALIGCRGLISKAGPDASI